MPKTNKKASMDVINILKSVIEYKVNPLLEGNRAVQEAFIMHKQIAALQNLIENNGRCDRSDRMEAEYEIPTKYKKQALAIGKKIKASKEAATALEQARKFYESYQTIKRITEIESLESKYKAWEIHYSLAGLELAKLEPFKQNLSKDQRKIFEKYDNEYNFLQLIKREINELKR